ncbi:hypothetical protein [Rhodoplanes sp. SY1]|uniref:hypothetical protein n=1 Tax=Rhodoplanes sp. SY1 TaxID=3166646 RepID=UPI0038B5F30D
MTNENLRQCLDGLFSGTPTRASRDGAHSPSPASVLGSRENHQVRASHAGLNSAVDRICAAQGLAPVEPDAAVSDPIARLDASIDRIVARSRPPAASPSKVAPHADVGDPLVAAVDRMVRSGGSVS